VTEKLKKTYLGDSVYVDFDGYYVTLTTENGVVISNTVLLEPPVVDALLDFIRIVGEFRNRITEA
jgi:hypothetical protein